MPLGPELAPRRDSPAVDQMAVPLGTGTGYNARETPGVPQTEAGSEAL